MEIQVQGNLTAVLKVVSQIVMTLFSGQPTELLYKKGVLKILAKIRGKHLRQSVFFNKVAGLRPATLLKKRLRHRVFLCECSEIFKNTFFTEYLRETPSVFYWRKKKILFTLSWKEQS